MRHADAFSSRHPAVNFAFFAIVICFGVTIQHPAYLLTGFAGACIYYLLLKGRQGLKMLLGMLPFLALVAAINPLVNTRGTQVLFYLLGRPYTFEALRYGMVVAGTLGIMLLWFGCYSVVMTSDKFTSLFGSLIPALSLLLVMVLRMVPNLMKKAEQFAGARRCIGKVAVQQATYKEKLTDGMTILSCLVSWSLEGGIVTGDSMRSRGYGAAKKRTSFMLYRMHIYDWVLLVLLLLLSAALLMFAAGGCMDAEFMPVLQIAPFSHQTLWALGIYCTLILLPTLLHIKEAIQWHISRSNI